MPIVTQCTAHGCETLTIGPLCIEHDHQPERIFVRGRPFARAHADRRVAVPVPSYTLSVRRASERAVAARPLR